MTTDIVNANSFGDIIDRWLKAEQEGEQFPVDFDIAWQIAGYATKASAKRAMESYMTESTDYIFNTVLKNGQRGRSSHLFALTCNALKELCMLSRSDVGKQTRLYFIEAEKKWKLVETHFPQVASQVDLMQQQADLVKLQLQLEQTKIALLEKREYISTVLPKPIGDRILGVTEVKEIEYRDRIIKNEDVINDGSTVNKTALCKRYGFLTPKGKPDYKRINQMIDQLPSDAFRLSATILENKELERSFLPMLDKLVVDSKRQLWLGEKE